MDRYYYKRLPIRDHVEKEMAAGRYQQGNAFGLVAGFSDIYGEMPVMCGHGGSNWLCKQCGDNLVKFQKINPPLLSDRP